MLNRYERLLMDCLGPFKLEGLRVVDSKPVETKRLARFGRHEKMGGSSVIREREGVGFNPLKGILCRIQDDVLYRRQISEPPLRRPSEQT